MSGTEVINNVGQIGMKGKWKKYLLTQKKKSNDEEKNKNIEWVGQIEYK